MFESFIKEYDNLVKEFGKKYKGKKILIPSGKYKDYLAEIVNIDFSNLTFLVMVRVHHKNNFHKFIDSNYGELFIPINSWKNFDKSVKEAMVMYENWKKEMKVYALFHTERNSFGSETKLIGVFSKKEFLENAKYEKRGSYQVIELDINDILKYNNTVAVEYTYDY